MELLIKLITKIISMKITGTLIINFNGQGGFKIKSEFGEEATYKLLTDKKY